MAGGPIITIIGNLTADPELRYTPSGTAVANFTVAVTPRVYDQQSSSWVDAETSFYRCVAWRQLGENAAESLTKGSRVIVHGEQKSRTYETREGEKRTTWEIDVDDLGPSVKYATANVVKTPSSGASRSANGNNVARQSQPAAAAATNTDDPWA